MLTDKQCKNASCPEGKARIRVTDSGGLYLEVAGAGSKRWFWKYYFDGKEKRLSLGSYPEVSLKDARAARDDARKQHQSGADPVLARQVDRLSSRFDANASFEVTAREFHATKRVGWSDHYAKRWLERLGKDIFPWLGKLPLSQIGAPMLLQTLRRVEARGARELPHSLLEACSQVFRYGVSTGRCERSPAADLRGALKPVLTRHVSAIVEPDKVGDLMRAIDGYHGQLVTRTALWLSAMLFQRPGNIRQMEWGELDLDRGMWTIPSEKMKRTKREKLNGRPHLVPLAPQAVAGLKDLHPLTGRGRYVFPALVSSKRPMSENTVRVGMQVAEPVNLHRKMPWKQAYEVAKGLLDKVRIPDAASRLHTWPHQYSGGMRQRTMIAMALACQPKLIIADEPTTALDVTVQAQILDLLKELTHETGAALILITHDLGVVARYADHVAVMYGGRIVEQAEAGALYANPRHPYTRGLLASIPRLDSNAGQRLVPINGQPPDLARLPSGCSFAPRCQHADSTCSASRPLLRELEPGHLGACHHDQAIDTNLSHAA